MVGAVLVSWGLTVAALVLWRLIRGFRTIPPFLQALIAFVTMWVVTSVLSFVLQVIFGIFSSALERGVGHVLTPVACGVTARRAQARRGGRRRHRHRLGSSRAP